MDPESTPLVITILERVGIPILTLLGGWFGHLWRTKQKKEAEKEAKREQKLQEYLRVAQPIILQAGGSISRSELNNLWVEQAGQDRSTVSRHITALIEAGKLVENDKTITVAAVPAT